MFFNQYIITRSLMRSCTSYTPHEQEADMNLNRLQRMSHILVLNFKSMHTMGAEIISTKFWQADGLCDSNIPHTNRFVYKTRTNSICIYSKNSHEAAFIVKISVCIASIILWRVSDSLIWSTQALSLQKQCPPGWCAPIQDWWSSWCYQKY